MRSTESREIVGAPRRFLGPDELSEGQILHVANPVPRIPRERALTFGQMMAMVVTVGIVVYGAGYLAWHWVHS
jgi:hypothetical protein